MEDAGDEGVLSEAEWGDVPGAFAGMDSERARVLQRIALTVKREGLSVEISEIQAKFRNALDPFDVLSDGLLPADSARIYGTLSEKLIDLWNYTTRPELGNRSPIDQLTELCATANRELAAKFQSPWHVLDACRVCLSPHNLELEEMAAEFLARYAKYSPKSR